MRVKWVGRDVSQLAKLDAECFPADTPIDPNEGRWFILWDGEKPAAFGGLAVDTKSHLAYFIRGGVSYLYRGKGLYKRLLNYAAKVAAREGARAIWTYCMTHNAASANGLYAAGFRVFDPSLLTSSLPDAIYFTRKL